MRLFPGTLLIGIVGLLVGAVPAQAQAQAGRVEFEIGAGYARGGGMEDSAPDLRASSMGLTFWLTDRWGVAASRARSHGEDLLPIRTEPWPGDRDFLGESNLRYTRLTVRHRRGSGPWSVGFGAGLVINGSFDTLARLHDTGERIGMRTDWMGFTIDSYIDRRVWRPFSVRAGVSLDTNAETTVLLTSVRAVVRF